MAWTPSKGKPCGCLAKDGKWVRICSVCFSKLARTVLFNGTTAKWDSGWGCWLINYPKGT